MHAVYRIILCDILQYMAKVLVAIVILAGIAVGAYFLFGSDNSFHVSFLGAWTGAKKSAVSPAHASTSATSTGTTIGDTLHAIGTSAWEAVQNAGIWIKNEGSNIISSLASSTTSAITDKAKDVAQETISSVQGKLGLSTDTNTAANSLLISYVIHPGDVISFAVHNTFASSTQDKLSYSIDWGDGITESETSIAIKDTFIFTHAWQKQGQYTVVFTMTSGNEESTYTTHVTVEQ